MSSKGLRDPSRLSDEIVTMIHHRAGSSALADIAIAFGEQATRRDGIELELQSNSAPRYYRVVWRATTVAYVRPRKSEVRADFRLHIDHWAYGWGFSQDSIYGIGLKIDGQIAFQVGMRLLDDAIKRAEVGA